MSFASDDEGWEVVDLPSRGDYAEVLSTEAVNWVSSGGERGGYIEFYDVTGQAFFFSAPAAFLGDQSAMSGGTLAFSLKSDQNAWDRDNYVILEGAGTLLVQQVAVPPTFDDWHAHAVSLTHDAWTDAASGSEPDDTTFEGVLAQLEALRIPGEFGSEIEETVGLDEVSLSGP